MDLLPAPRLVAPKPGAFTLPPDGSVSGPFADAVRLALPQAAGVSTGQDASLGPEAYTLDVAPEGVTIAAGGRSGAFYAAITLRQMLPPATWRSAVPPGTVWSVPCVHVEDGPRYGWRGALLDVARHFLPKRGVLRFIDLLAMHKLNRLHLHLVDDQGWRVESPRHPRLHEVGAWRTRSSVAHFREPPAYDDTPHGGYYTLADLAEIASYAGHRGVTVVPEIDVPGHASALLAAYPSLGSSPGTAYEVWSDWGISRNILSPLPETVAFLTDIFGELLSAVPSSYVHIGGDECVLDTWECGPIDDYRRSLGLASAAELHAWFLRGLADVLSSYGCRAVVWDEAFASGTLRPDSLVMAWRSMEIARRAAEAGHDVIATPVVPTYLDYAESTDPREPLAIGGPLSNSDVASFDPAVHPRVIGTQFQLWTERIPDERTLDYRAWPRGAALAEVAWTGSSSWDSLRPRLEAHLLRLDALGVEYRPLAGPHPWQQGGSGWRRHRPRAPRAAKIMEYLTQAAAHAVDHHGTPPGDTEAGDDLQ